MADDLTPLAAALRIAWSRLNDGGVMRAERWEAAAIAAREHLSAAKPAAPTERPTCATCAYWDADPIYDGQNGGDCHLIPNRRRKLGGDFCGDHPAFPAWIAARAEGGR